MSLVGRAAMLLSFDVAPECIDEHDDWHTHEHFPERLSIPGFLRGTRWVALRGEPRYLVVYEVEQLAVLSSEAYLARLDHPTPWTSKMMPHYRGMSRGFCSVTGSFGLGAGNVGLLMRFKPRAEEASSLRRWLVEESLGHLVSKRGIGAAHLLEGAATPAMTNEQRMRGADAGIDWAVFVAGYRRTALEDVVTGELAPRMLQQHGAADVSDAIYAIDYSLTDREAAGVAPANC